MFLKENRWRGAIRGGSRSHAASEDLPTGKELLLRLQAGDRLFLLSFAEPVTWWLCTPGGKENWRMAVETDGRPSVEGYSAERGEISVRPAMWLDLGRLSLLNEDGGNQPE